jgi:hypothetical protein
MKKTTEAGKRNNSVDQARIQQMHDNSVELGADCADETPAKESMAPWLREAVLRAGDSAAAKHQAIGKAVDSAYSGSRGYAYTRDVFPKHVVVSHGDKMFAHTYSTDQAGNVNLGDPVEVESTYSPMKEADFLEAVSQGALFISERSIPQSVRDNADAGDFAGKGKSFPILKAEDVGAALSSIGRAGSGNYSAAELKSRILAIAKRKGFAIPASDKKESGTGLADGLIRLEESCCDLIEKAVRADGTIPIKVIAPGWGSSGYYPKEVLERDGPKVFSKGLHMYLDHPTPTEESERPERSVKDLAATLTSNARWMENGSAGPGLYADAQVTSPYRQFIEEVSDKIGVSIRAAGTAESGQAEGRKGPIIKSLAQAESVDFVTRAGAGGKILQLYEAARTRQPSTGASEMDEKEIMKLREAAAKGERLIEVGILREAKDLVAEKLAKLEHLPDMVKARLAETLAKNPPVAGEGLDRTLDKAKFDTTITEGIKAEVAYLASLGIGDGAVRGMGASQTAGDDPKKLQADLTESFKRLGVGEKIAGIAATGRPN